MNILVIVVFCVTVFSVQAQVATKLDLEENLKEETSSRNPSSSDSTSKISPKIQGVRVTVDTGEGKKGAETESKESVELIDTKNTKRVGIHTDITFEITDDKNESNATSSEQAEKDNDASVPIFKGRGTTRRPSHRMPYNPKVLFDYPNGQPDYHINRDRDSHHYNKNNHNVPVFPRTNDDGTYQNIDRWASVIPITGGVWTTERSSYYTPPRMNNGDNFRNYQQQLQHQSFGQERSEYAQRPQQQSNPDWQPCVCLYDNANWKDANALQVRNFRSAEKIAGSHLDETRVDGKKNNPFSSTEK